MNMLAMFMKTINNLFMDMLVKEVVVFLDGVLIYSTMMEKHFELLEKVLAYLCKHVFSHKLKKCSFLQKTATFLGFDITPEGLHINNANVQSLKKWPKPTTVY